MSSSVCSTCGKRERPIVKRDDRAEPEEFPLLVDEGRLICIPTEVSGKAQPAVIDSGSSLNIISDDTVRKHRLTVAPCRQTILLRLADGTSASPVGQVDVDFTINGDKFTASCVVLKGFPYRFLLGLDFIMTAPVDIMPSKGVISIGSKGTTISLAKTVYRLPEDPMPLFTIRSVTVPPLSEAIVELKCDTKSEAKIVVVDGKPMSAGIPLLLSATVSAFRRRPNACGPAKIFARVLNPTAAPVTVQKNTELATATIVREEDCFVISPASTENLPASPPKPEPERSVDLSSLVVNENLDHDQRQGLEAMIRRVGMDVFSVDEFDLGRTDIVKHVIDTGTTAPVRRPPYRKSFKEREGLHRLVTQFEKHGIIRKSMSPYAAPVVLVRKKDGSLRFCCDWRELNKVTKKDSMPLPRVDDTLDRLAGSAWFTTADFTAGYYQVEVDEASKEKTAFITPDGLWEFNVLGMGLCNAPATFMRLMHHVLGDLMWTVCMSYLDDVIIFSKSYDEHLRHVEAVLSAVQKAGLKLKPKKCAFAMQQIEFLGHVVSKEGIRPDPAKLRAVADFPPPSNIKEVMQFLGLAGYYRRFVKGFSATAKPLTELLMKGSEWDMNATRLSAFTKLKDMLTSPPVLAHPDFTKPFIVSTDASNFAVGAVLKQKGDDGKDHAIAYFSQCMNKAELNYSATEKECLAVILAVKKFRPYLYGTRFTIVTDHCALCWLMRVRNPNGRLVRWSLMLQDLDFEIEYESGRKHLEADALSRAPVDPAPVSDDEEPLLVCQRSAGDVSVRELQAKEVWLQPILQHLQDPDLRQDRKTRRRARCFLLKDGLVFRRSYSGESPVLTLVLPKALRVEVLQALHDHVTSGHLGVSKTYKKIKSRFFWPKMFSDVKAYVLSCKKCGGNKVCNQAPMGLMQPLPPTCKPFERVGLDKLGPFQQSIDGNVHVLVLTDYATRMVFAKAVPDGTAAETAKFLVQEVILRHGSPKEVLTDRGTEFVNKTFDLVASVHGIRHKTTSAYHPRTNGLTERFNGTLAKMMSAYTETHRDWDRFLPYLVFAYNTSVHEVTGYTPYFLLHGFEPTLGIELQLDERKALDNQFTFENIAYATRAREIAAAATERSQIKAKQRFDERRRDRTFAPGDSVWIRRIHRVLGKTEKLLPAYLGPFRIIRQTASNDYEVEDADGHRDVVNVERFKPFMHRLADLTADEEAIPALPPQDVTSPRSLEMNDDLLRLPAHLQFSTDPNPESLPPPPEAEEWPNSDDDNTSDAGLADTFMDYDASPVPPPVVDEPPTDGFITRSGRLSRPPGWVSRCAPSTL